MTALPWKRSPWAKSDILWSPRYPNTRWRGVFTAITRLVTLTEPTYVWRGHHDIYWLLVPSITRKLGQTPPLGPRKVEDARAATLQETEGLIRRSRDHRHDQLDHWTMPDLALLALLQHNGAATPLLDVTTDPIVALHFACEGSADQDGVVLAIDVRRDRVQHFAVGARETWAEAVALVSAENRLGLYTPPMVTPRIMAQRGRFIFGAVTEGVSHSVLPLAPHPDWSKERLSNLFEPAGAGRPTIPPVVAIRIPAADKARIRTVIDMTYGLNSETLFPDFSGFARAHSAAPV